MRRGLAALGVAGALRVITLVSDHLKDAPFGGLPGLVLEHLAGHRRLLTTTSVYHRLYKGANGDLRGSGMRCGAWAWVCGGLVLGLGVGCVGAGVVCI